MLGVQKVPKRLAPHFAEVFWVNPVHQASLPEKRATIPAMSHKKDAEPLKLMPLDELKKVVQKIAHISKDAIEQTEAERSKHKGTAKKP
jgi:uncharacterized small protein (DUF1192 family)